MTVKCCCCGCEQRRGAVAVARLQPIPGKALTSKLNICYDSIIFCKFCRINQVTLLIILCTSCHLFQFKAACFGLASTSIPQQSVTRQTLLRTSFADGNGDSMPGDVPLRKQKSNVRFEAGSLIQEVRGFASINLRFLTTSRKRRRRE